ncbi:hypothetical protein TNCV_5065421 [Trichonephila clavipes]|nr:hypothetical protein TNCV_5065421 [Trichonephila clavipes]
MTKDGLSGGRSVRHLRKRVHLHCPNRLQTVLSSSWLDSSFVISCVMTSYFVHLKPGRVPKTLRAFLGMRRAAG